MIFLIKNVYFNNNPKNGASLWKETIPQSPRITFVVELDYEIFDYLRSVVELDDSEDNSH